MILIIVRDFKTNSFNNKQHNPFKFILFCPLKFTLFILRYVFSRYPGVFSPPAQGYNWICWAEDWCVSEPKGGWQCNPLLPPYWASSGRKLYILYLSLCFLFLSLTARMCNIWNHYIYWGSSHWELVNKLQNNCKGFGVIGS